MITVLDLRIQRDFFHIPCKRPNFQKVFLHQSEKFRLCSVYFDVAVNFLAECSHLMHSGFIFVKFHNGNLMVHYIVIRFKYAFIVLGVP